MIAVAHEGGSRKARIPYRASYSTAYAARGLRRKMDGWTSCYAKCRRPACASTVVFPLSVMCVCERVSPAIGYQEPGEKKKRKKKKDADTEPRSTIQLL